ncbi:MAG: hypothetical protein WBD16_12185 [Pyrinomonadaceae bacterium]
MKVLVQSLLVMTFLAGAAFAQVKELNAEMSLAGKQTSAGIYDPTVAETQGNTFVLDSSDSSFSSTLLTVSFDFLNDVDYDNGNEISGGEWNLAIYKGGQYRGSIYGKITGGYIRWANSQDLRLTDAYLSILGGTGGFEDTPEGEAYLRAETILSNNQTSVVITGMPL